jgi:nicotinamide-nucleotide amidase
MSLNKKIVSLLKKKKIKIAIAESCTGGMLSSSIVSINGASKVFNVGLVTYSDQAKKSFLKVEKNVIKKHGAVSIQCCLSMVNNLSKITRCEICVSITGIAGPKGGSKQKPVGLVYIGVKNKKRVIVSKNLFKNKGRISIQKATTKKALNLILKHI